MTWKAYDDIDY